MPLRCFCPRRRLMSFCAAAAAGERALRCRRLARHAATIPRQQQCRPFAQIFLPRLMPPCYRQSRRKRRRVIVRAARSRRREPPRRRRLAPRSRCRLRYRNLRCAECRYAGVMRHLILPPRFLDACSVSPFRRDVLTPAAAAPSPMRQQCARRYRAAPMRDVADFSFASRFVDFCFPARYADFRCARFTFRRRVTRR